MKRQLMVIGEGTAGTMIVNKLRRRLDMAEWGMTIVDRDDVHPCQPGYLLPPFETYSPDQINRTRRFLEHDQQEDRGRPEVHHARQHRHAHAPWASTDCPA